MEDEQKIQLANRIIEIIESERVNDDMPVMVGTLKKELGLNGFDKAEIGHPVFEIKDRYIIYLQSSTELKEKVYNHKLQGFETKIGFFKVAVPYYKETLKPVINFL